MNIVEDPIVTVSKGTVALLYFVSKCKQSLMFIYIHIFYYY